MEYCPFGDMWNLLRAQLDFYVPEPFVWFFFETLAKAGLLMERGDLEQYRGDGFWKLVLHRDLKLENSRAALLSEPVSLSLICLPSVPWP